MTRTLSIVVVALNEVSNLPRLKRALDALDRPEGWAVETLLVDNGSTDGTPDLARDVGFTQIIASPGANLPTCRNRGAEAATGDWIAFIDADCEPARDWLRVASAFCEEERIVGWFVSPPEPPTWVQRAWHYHWMTKNPHAEVQDGRRVYHKETFRLITTSNLLLPRALFLRLGGFDPELATGEDMNLLLRAHAAGVPAIAVPDLRVTHYGEPATLSQFFRQQRWHANRKSYAAIQRLTGGQAGGNAPRFARIFTGCFLLASAGLATVFWRWQGGLLLLPLLGLVTVPAVGMALRGRRATMAMPLAVLYFLYGSARMIDLLGFHPRKDSWRSRPERKPKANHP